MQRPSSVSRALKTAKPELQRYVVALESENGKLHRQIAKLQVQDVSKQNRILALEKENKELSKKHGYHLQIIDLSDQEKKSSPNAGSSA